MNKEKELKIELEIIENLLSDPEYDISGMEFYNETNAINIAMKVQQELIALKNKIITLENKVQELTPTSKYKEVKHKYKNLERLEPPAYIPTKEEISLAKARYVMEENIWGIVHYLIMYINLLEGKEIRRSNVYTPEIIKTSAIEAIKKWNEAMNKWNDVDDIWEAFLDKEWFNSTYIDSLSVMHEGDCTAIACSCMRCQAENVFNIPSTVTWGKSEGYKLYQEFNEDFEMKNKIIPL